MNFWYLFAKNSYVYTTNGSNISKNLSILCTYFASSKNYDYWIGYKSSITSNKTDILLIFGNMNTLKGEKLYAFTHFNYWFY